MSNAHGIGSWSWPDFPFVPDAPKNQRRRSKQPGTRFKTLGYDREGEISTLWHYVPTTRDLERMRLLFPSANPCDPDWCEIKRALLARHREPVISRMRAETALDALVHLRGEYDGAGMESHRLAQLSEWIEAAKEVVHRIGCTRGLHAAYYSPEHRVDEPWPTESAECLQRDTAKIAAYLQERHRLEIAEPFERLAQSAATWMTKREAIEAFATVKYADSDAVSAAVQDLVQRVNDGLPEQKRLRLDLRIAEGAVFLASFPLLAEQFGIANPFLMRSRLVQWAIWVRDAFAKALRDWPDESNSSDRPESEERWQLANVIFPRVISNTNETPEKLAIDEARRAEDLAVALPRIECLMNTLRAFVRQSTNWPQGNYLPDLTEDLCSATNDLLKLVGPDSPKSTPNGGVMPKPAGLEECCNFIRAFLPICKWTSERLEREGTVAVSVNEIVSEMRKQLVCGESDAHEVVRVLERSGEIRYFNGDPRFVEWRGARESVAEAKREKLILEGTTDVLRRHFDVSDDTIRNWSKSPGTAPPGVKITNIRHGYYKAERID